MESSARPPRQSSQILLWGIGVLSLVAIGWLWWSGSGQNSAVNARIEGVVRDANLARSRADEANRKADETAATLVPNVQRLQQQVTAAETKADQTQKQTSDALSDLAKVQSQTAGQIVQVQGQLGQLQAQGAQAVGQIARLQDQLEQAHALAAETGSQTAQVREQVEQLRAQGTQIAGQMAQAQQLVEQLRTQGGQTTDQMAQIQAKFDQLQGQGNQVAGQLARALAQLEQAQAQAQSQAQAQVLAPGIDPGGQLAQTQKLIESLRAQGTQADERIAQVQSQVEQLRAQGSQSDTRMVQVVSQVEQLQTQLRQSQSVLAEAQDQTAQVNQQIQQLTDRMRAAQAQGVQTEDRFAEMQTQVAQMLRQLNQAQARVDESQERIAQIRTQMTQSQAEIAQLTAQSGDVRALTGTVREIDARVAANESAAAETRRLLGAQSDRLTVEVDQIKKATASDTSRLVQDVGEANQQIAKLRAELAEATPRAETVQRLREISDALKAAEQRVAADQSATARNVVALTQELDRVRVTAADKSVAVSALQRSEQVGDDLARLRENVAAAQTEVNQKLARLDIKTLTAMMGDEVARGLDSLSPEIDRLHQLEKSVVATEAATSCPAEGAYPLSIYFAANSAQVDDESRRSLSSFVRGLEGPSAKNCRLTIYGYADQRGNSPANQSLSLRRAVAVRKLMVDSGLNETRIITVMGLGAEAGTGDSRSEASREQDRRVVISIVR